MAHNRAVLAQLTRQAAAEASDALADNKSAVELMGLEPRETVRARMRLLVRPAGSGREGYVDVLGWAELLAGSGGA